MLMRGFTLRVTQQMLYRKLDFIIMAVLGNNLGLQL